ncbi:MAG: hypothetical protein NTX42_07135 [Methanothrix sp.]|nr:hypothetical protein [Methanothrix sp.]
MNLIRLLNSLGILFTLAGAVWMLWSAKSPKTTWEDLEELNKNNRISAGLVFAGAILQMIAVFLGS